MFIVINIKTKMTQLLIRRILSVKKIIIGIHLTKNI